MGQQLQARAKQLGAEGHPATGLDALRVLTEEIEVEAEIEDAEVLLVVVRPEQLRAEPRPASDHLPELDLRVEPAEEDQISPPQARRCRRRACPPRSHVRHLVLLRKVVEHALRIFRVVVNDSRKVSLVLRVHARPVGLRRRRVASTMLSPDPRTSVRPATVGSHWIPVYLGMSRIKNSDRGHRGVKAKQRCHEVRMAPNPQHPRRVSTTSAREDRGDRASLCNNYTGRQHPRRVGRRHYRGRSAFPKDISGMAFGSVARVRRSIIVVWLLLSAGAACDSGRNLSPLSPSDVLSDPRLAGEVLAQWSPYVGIHVTGEAQAAYRDAVSALQSAGRLRGARIEISRSLSRPTRRTAPSGTPGSSCSLVQQRSFSSRRISTRD